MHALIGQALFSAALLLQPQIVIPPAPRGYAPNAADVVVDAAGVLKPETIARINSIAFDVKQKSGGEMAVVTLPDLGGRTSEEVALAIGRAWKIGGAGEVGDRARNAGVVILVVPKETSRDARGYIRIETGRGTEGFINDARAGEMRDEALPALRAADYNAAIELIALRVAQRFASEFNFALDSTFAPPAVEQAPRERSGGVEPIIAVVMIAVILVILIALAKKKSGGAVMAPPMYGRRRRRNDWWIGGGGFGGFGGGGGGGGGGGFGGFGGGGGFSGGGAGGSW